MEIVGKYLQQRLPFEICAELQAWTHDFAPVMEELLKKHRPIIPQLIVRTKTIGNVRRLLNRYKNDLHGISFDPPVDGKPVIYAYSVEIGRTNRIDKCRLNRYVRQPRLSQNAWREVGALI